MPEPRISVPSSEFARQFGQLRVSASRDPVFITHHGRETHVLVTATRYSEMVANGTVSGAPIGEPSIGQIAGWIHQGLIILDADMRIVLANPVAHAMVERTEGQLVSKPLFEAIPELVDTLVQGYVLRAVNGREPITADLPSIFRKGSWIRLEVFPSAHYTTLIWGDITEDVTAHRLADTKKALVEAMRLHGGIGYIRIGARNQIERVDATICGMLKLPETRLLGVSVVDVVDVGARVAFREVVERVMRGEGARQITTNLLANDGNLIPICAALAELRGAYGSEGAVLVVTGGERCEP